MINLFSRIKQAHSFFKIYRQHGCSVTVATIVLLLKVFIFFLKNINLKGKIDLQEHFINTTVLFEEDNLYNDVNTKKSDILAKYSLNNIKACDSQKTFIWSIPSWLNIYGGGHYTLFRFINHFSKYYGIKNIIYLYDYQAHFKSLVQQQEELNLAFDCKNFFLTKDFKDLPFCDAAIATTWQSAYFIKQMIAKQKFYFMQDYESLFYAAGSSSLQANHSYTFGFHGITGGNWLKNIFESYGTSAQEYIFSADRDIFYPKNPNNPVKRKVERIFFYGRPSTERRAYELGIAALELISKQFPDIEIVMAGSLDVIVPAINCKVLGNLSLKQTGDIYRDCDIGIALSATNMSYLPVELMASGCPVVSNKGPQVEWFCKDNFNALLAAPTPKAILNAVESLINSYDLRSNLVYNGLATISKTTWNEEMDKIYKYIDSILCKNFQPVAL